MRLAELSDQLRRIADQLDSGALDTNGLGGGGATASGGLLVMPGHVLADTGPDYPDFDANGICVADFWVRGRAACMKGAHLSDYSTGSQFIYMLGADFPHLLVCSTRELGPPGATGSQLMASVADAGWVDGRDYQPRNPPGQNYDDFVNHGRPSGNRFGKFDARGEFVTGGSFSPGGPTA